MAVAFARHLLDNNEVPSQLLCEAWRLILWDVTVALHLAPGRQEVPCNLCTGQG